MVKNIKCVVVGNNSDKTFTAKLFSVIKEKEENENDSELIKQIIDETVQENKTDNRNEELIQEHAVLFEMACSWEELIDLNKKFIKGELIATSYHFGPLEKDSQTIIQDLLDLHDKGILTVNGQTGATGTSYNVWSDYANGYVDTKQAPYLDFFIEKSRGKKLEKELKKDKWLKYSYWDNDELKYTNYRAVYALTMERSAETIDELKKTEWSVYSRGGNMDSFNTCDISHIPFIDESNDYYRVQVILPEFGTKKSIEKRLLKMLENI